MNITEIARLHGFSVGKVTGGSSIDGLVNDLVTGGEDKALTAEMGKVLNKKKILEYGGLLQGDIDFDSLTPNRIYKVGDIGAGSIGAPPSNIVYNGGDYSILEVYEADGYFLQRMSHVASAEQFIIYRSYPTQNKWGAWKQLEVANAVNPEREIDNLRYHVAEKAYKPLPWKSQVPEQMSIVFPVEGGLPTGILELTIASTYTISDATGGAKVRYHIVTNESGVPVQHMEIESISPSFANHFHVFPMEMTEDKTAFLIPIGKKNSNMPITITAKYYASHGNAFRILYNSYLMVWDRDAEWGKGIGGQFKTAISSFKVQKDIPEISLSTADGKRSAAIRLNANSAVDYGLDFWKDQNVFMRAMGQNDVKFYDPTTGWFSIQSLKQSVSNGKANVAQAITDVGWGTSPDATFDEMASNIRRLGTVKEAKGTAYATAGYMEVRGIGFKPKAILCKAEGVSDAKMGNVAYIGDEWINGWSDVSMYVSSWDRNSIQSDVVLYDDGFRIRVDDTNRNGAFGYYAVGRNI